MFLACMKQHCETVRPSITTACPTRRNAFGLPHFQHHSKKSKEKKECLSTAQMYYTGTHTLGCPAFEASQKEACSCVKDEL